jgi:two-component system chemotaxis response regulator CheY
MTKHVLSVGQCGPDNYSLSRFLQSKFDVQFETAETAADTLDRLRKSHPDLVLINRKLDCDYSDGADIIRLIKADPKVADIPVMLVTNYPEHQEQAVALGAEYGFGKLEFGSPDVVSRLEPFLKG